MSENIRMKRKVRLAYAVQDYSIGRHRKINRLHGDGLLSLAASGTTWNPPPS